MAELAPVAADVQQIAGGVDRSKKSGEAITAGDVVYLGTDGKWHLAENNSGTTTAQVSGLALSTAPGADQPLAVALPASAGSNNAQCIVDLGVVLDVGETYYLASTPGKVEPFADVQTGERVTACLFAKDADQAIFQPVPTDALKP